MSVVLWIFLLSKTFVKLFFGANFLELVGPNNTIKGSMRTTSEFDLTKLAKLFGGGGHKKAAGFICREEQIQQLQN